MPPLPEKTSAKPFSARPAALLTALCAAAVVANAALGAWFIRSSSPTYDEPPHLASGYVALTTPLPPLHDRDHGPLAEMWDALPLLLLKPSTLWGDPSWGRLYHYGDAFLYRNRVPAPTLLNWARFWSLISWTSILAVPLLLWAFRLGGASAAAFAAVLASFCPLWLSSAALVTTDAGSSALFFLAFWILSADRRGLARWTGAGLAVGAAVSAKYNMAVLPALIAAAWLTERRLRGERSIEWKGPLLASVAAAAVVGAAFRGRWGFFAQALWSTLSHLSEGRGAFLCGRYSTKGWLWYFPFALTVKSPLTFLIAAFAGLALLPRLAPSRERVWLLLGPALYFAAACHSNTQIGVRHVLPVVPFLMVLGACAGAWAWRQGSYGKAWALGLALWLVVSVVRSGPDYLAYFNEAAGGPQGGWKLLADSNLDWGQGLKALGAELHRRGDPPVVLSYFGVGDPAFYGIRYIPVGFVTNVDRPGWPAGLAPRPGDRTLLAVSQTNLQGVYFQDHDVFGWVRNRTPAFVAGDSIFVYDLTDDAPARRRLAALLYSTGARRWARAVASAP